MPIAKLIEKAHLEGAICFVDQLFTAEAEYITTGACCAQILYMKQTLLDYGLVLEKVHLLCAMRAR